MTNEKVHVKKIEILSRLIKESSITKKEALILLEDEQLENQDIEDFKNNIRLNLSLYNTSYFSFTNSTTTTDILKT